APSLATREACRGLGAIEAELLQQVAGLMPIIRGAESGRDIAERSRMADEVRLLRQIADGCTRLHKARAVVGLDEARGDAKQARFAGTVAADQAHALAGGDRKLRTLQQRRAAESERNIAELQKGR